MIFVLPGGALGYWEKAEITPAPVFRECTNAEAPPPLHTHTSSQADLGVIWGSRQEVPREAVLTSQSSQGPTNDHRNSASPSPTLGHPGLMDLDGTYEAGLWRHSQAGLESPAIAQ